VTEVTQATLRILRGSHKWLGR